MSSRQAGRVAGWRRRRGVRKLAAAGTAESARRLAELFIEAADDAERGIAERALTTLAGQDARDAACAVAIATGDERLRTFLAAAGHLPSDPGRRALWLFLDGRFDEAAELDFDGGLLRAAHQSADAELRRRIAGKARAAGRVEWVRAVVGEPGPHRLRDLTDDEWESTLSVLTAARRWDELWRLTLSAPLPWAVRLLRALGAHDWRPATQSDHDGYAHLRALAERCDTPPSIDSLFGDKCVLAEGGAIYNAGRLAVSRGGDLLCVTDDLKQRVCFVRLPSAESAGEVIVKRLIGISLAMTRDGSAVAVGCYGGAIKLLSPPAGGVSADWTTTSRGARELAFAPDGDLLAGSMSGGGLRVWEVPSGRQLWSVRGSVVAHRGRGALDDMAITPDGRLLVTCDSVFRMNRLRGEVRVRDLRSGEQVGFIDLGVGDYPKRLLVTPDGRRLVTVTNHQVHLWALPSLSHVATMNDKRMYADVAMSEDGKVLVFVRGRADVIEVRRTADGEVVASFDWDRLPDSVALAVSRDGRLLLAAGRWDGQIHAWHLPSGEPAGILGDNDAGAGWLTFAPDGATIAVTNRGFGPRRRETDQVMMWRPEPVLLGRVPTAEVTAEEAERLRLRTRKGDDRPWGELLTALVQWRHRHDVELGDAVGAPSGTDIEVGE